MGRTIHPKGGETYRHAIQVTDGLTGEPIDTTDWTWRGQVRPYYGGPIDCSFQFTAVDATLGFWSATLTADEASALAEQYDEEHPALYDLEATVGGERMTYMGGEVHPEPDVTR